LVHCTLVTETAANENASDSVAAALPLAIDATPLAPRRRCPLATLTRIEESEFHTVSSKPVPSSRAERQPLDPGPNPVPSSVVEIAPVAGPFLATSRSNPLVSAENASVSDAVRTTTDATTSFPTPDPALRRAVSPDVDLHSDAVLAVPPTRAARTDASCSRNPLPVSVTDTAPETGPLRASIAATPGRANDSTLAIVPATARAALSTRCFEFSSPDVAATLQRADETAIQFPDSAADSPTRTRDDPLAPKPVPITVTDTAPLNATFVCTTDVTATAVGVYENAQY
jgi:hypothetical protein